MKTSCVARLLAISAIIAQTQANPSQSSIDLIRRAFSDSPTGGYAPGQVDCPTDPLLIREASGLSENETQWLQKRRSNTVQPMQDFLGRMKIPNFDAISYIKNHASNVSMLPNVALAFSGGGYRALLSGGGALKAFDSRTTNATGAGQLGGLLQSTTYVAGLSGGSWLVGSMFLNNFSSIEALQQETQGSLWEFGNSIFQGPASGVVDQTKYYSTLIDEVNSKKSAGFDTTLTDIWGRALSFQLINATNGGPGITWSSIAETEDFANGNIPFPIVIADNRSPGQLVIPQNTTVFEFNPFEFGSFDPTTYGFVPLRFLGSNFTNGKISPDGRCIRGFDNAGFVIGTSSSLFNTFFLQINTTSIPDVFKTLLRNLLGDLSANDEDIADYTPNPFFGWNNATNPNAASTQLTLVDGGEDNENLPFNPLIQPHRSVDVIFAVDSSADTPQNWPNGSSLVQTYERSLNSTIQNGTAFPSVPDTNTFINLGLNTRPTFFGCNASNMTGPTPLIVYIPNTPYIFQSNVSTESALKFTTAVRDAIIENGYDVATAGNATVEKDWPVCAGCAMLSRSFDRTQTTVPDACQQCYQRYCWNGTIDSRTPAPFLPNFVIAPLKVTSNAVNLKFGMSLSAIIAVVIGATLVV